MPPHHSEDRGGVLIGVGVAFIILELLAFGLRITARWLRRVPFGFDDALMFPALVLNLALCIMGIGECKKTVSSPKDQRSFEC